MNATAFDHVQFDEARHIYRIGGQIVPSVTQVLDAVLGDGFNHDERAAQFGTNVHKAIALDLRGRLDLAQCDEALLPYVTAARRFIHDNRVTVIASEAIVASLSPRFCGTLDLYGLMRETQSAVFDFKTGAPGKLVGPQTAAYANGFKVPNAKRYAITLHADGHYEMVPCKDAADWSLFVSCLNVFNWKARKR
jgi:hypothetical protein